MGKTINAKDLRTPIYFSVEDIRGPVEASNKEAAIRGLLDTATRNTTQDRQSAVSALVRMTGNARAIRRNAERQNNGGR